MISTADARRGVALLARRNVTILGYGQEGAAHALCLRDCGVDVRVGLPEGDPDWASAEAEGFAVRESYEACEEADLVMLLAPPREQAALYDGAVADNLVRGDTLLVADGFALRTGAIRPPADVDVALVSPVGDGRLIRREFAAGRGVPVVIAVAQDPSGSAWDLARGYAGALGGLRSGVVETTVAEAADAAAFGAAAVTVGGVPELMRAAWETLVEAGYAPDVAYLECMHAAKAAMDAAWAGGIAQLKAGAEPWRAFLGAGDALDAPAMRARMRDVLDDIRSGEAADAFLAAPPPPAEPHPSDGVGAELRDLMPWLRHPDGDAAGERWR